MRSGLSRDLPPDSLPHYLYCYPQLPLTLLEFCLPLPTISQIAQNFSQAWNLQAILRQITTDIFFKYCMSIFFSLKFWNSQHILYRLVSSNTKIVTKFRKLSIIEKCHVSYNIFWNPELINHLKKIYLRNLHYNTLFTFSKS